MCVCFSTLKSQRTTYNKEPPYTYRDISPKGESFLLFFHTSHTSLNLSLFSSRSRKRKGAIVLHPHTRKKTDPFGKMTGQQAGREQTSNIIYCGNSRKYPPKAPIHDSHQVQGWGIARSRSLAHRQLCCIPS